ncbi:hypothetical protein ACFQ60_03530 [Streptomyces zhihengii]|uniref:Uncharacterized protein n=1 Tax=Streptomyces zhihengii TaxID=1818004 RepID=A0ABS2V3H0_9ACTN|nr:hypothetical protein [Streptomyces zhihengii]MBM9623994.1 hypothetical protein [Streptomyces zhihengii]
MTTGRHHLLLTIHGKPAMHGWWEKHDTADRMRAAWTGEYGDTPGVRIVLVDQLDDSELSWP